MRLPHGSFDPLGSARRLNGGADREGPQAFEYAGSITYADRRGDQLRIVTAHAMASCESEHRITLRSARHRTWRMRKALRSD